MDWCAALAGPLSEVILEYHQTRRCLIGSDPETQTTLFFSPTLPLSNESEVPLGPWTLDRDELDDELEQSDIGHIDSGSAWQ